MKRSGRRAVGAVRAAAAACLLALGARAQGPDARVTVDCPGLHAEQRAALEARAKADLIVRHEVGALAFRCTGDVGSVTWTLASGQTSRGEVPLPPDADAAIERLLEDAERLLLASHATSEVAAVAAPEAPAPEPRPEQPPAAPPPVTAAPERPEPPAESAPPPRRRRPGPPFGVAAGPAFEVWDLVPALGGGVLLRWYAAGPLRFDAGGTLLFSTEDRLGITGRLVRFHLGGEYAFADGHRCRLGVRVLVDDLKANPGADLQVSAASDTSVAARLHFQYAVPIADAWHLAFGPYLGVRAAPVRVELGSSEAFSIPVITGGAEILLEWDGR